MRRKVQTVLLIILVSAGSLIPALAQDENRSSGAYSVLPGDVLLISVWKEPDLQFEVLVRPDSAFSFPLAGEISTKNKSVADIQAELTERLSVFLSSPLVTVLLRSVLGNKVYVIGQVNEPGEFLVNPHVDVLQALSMAGGLTTFASTKNIKVFRRTESGQITLLFNYGDVMKGESLDQNIVLQSGDVVAVP